MKVHCIGDSHTSFFTGYNVIQPEYPQVGTSVCKSIVTYRIGSPLAYNLCKVGSNTKSNEKLFSILNTLNPDLDIVLLSFGEVDCRAHIIKQAELNGVPVEDVVEECIRRYLIVIRQIKKMNFNIIVWNAVPTAVGFENVKFEYPYYGTYQQRNNACIIFNMKLKNYSRAEGFYFLEVYEKIIGDDLLTKNSFFFDKIHLGSKLLPYTLKLINKEFPQVNVKWIELFKIRIRYWLFRFKIQYQVDKIITFLNREEIKVTKSVFAKK